MTAPLSTNRATIASIPFQLPPGLRDSSGPLTPRNAILARADGTMVSPLTLHPGTIFIRPVLLAKDGNAQFFLPAEIDLTYLIEATTNFVSWLALSTNTATGTFMDLVDTDAPLYPRRFYRSVPFVPTGPIRSVRLAGDDLLVLQLSGQPGDSYTLQSSINLLDWTIDSGVTLTSGDAYVTNRMSATSPMRFFRLDSPP